MASKTEKKKLKKLRRLQEGGSMQHGGNVPHAPKPSSNISQMLAQLQTVNKQDEVQQPSLQPQVEVSGNLPNAEAEDDNEWDDDEDANDGGSIPVNPVQAEVQVSAPLVEAVAIPVSEVAPVETPIAELDSASVQLALSSATENRNIQTQPEANQENNMNVVNHPAVAATAQPAPTTTPDSGIVAEGAMERMQSDAARTEAATPVSVGGADSIPTEDAPKAKPQAAFHNIQITSMFTLDLTNFDYMMGLKSSLSRVSLGDDSLNLYSPFRRGGKRTDPKPAAEGVIRSVLPSMLDVTDAVNNSRIMVVGGADEVQKHIMNSIDITKQNIVNLFPVDGSQVVASFLNEEQDATIQLQMSDIVNIRSWVNSSAANTEEDVPFEIHNAIINTTVNAGMLYDAEDRVKEIHRIIKSLELMVSKRDEANTTVVLAVALDASLLADASIREMLDTLLSDEGFAIYSRQELLRLDENDFLPQTREAVENALLVPKSDIILMRIVTQEEEEEEGEAEEGGEAPEAAADDEAE
jgi:hypothetical protein